MVIFEKYAARGTRTDLDQKLITKGRARSVADLLKLPETRKRLLLTRLDLGTPTIGMSAYYWSSVACSEDGRKMVALAAQGQIFTARPPPPSLGISRSGTNFTLSWATNAGVFQLQQRSNLTTAAWTVATNSTSVTNGQNQVIVSESTSQAFFRLQGQ